MPSYHDRVPRTLRANLLFRRKLLDEIKTPLDRESVRLMCAEDCLFWVNAFAWQLNPKARGSEVGPFITYPFQETATNTILGCIAAGEDLVIEKSRDMGLSWLNLLIGVHKLLFHPYSTGLYVSRSAEAVDDESPDSLFWKIDFILKYLPDWMVPKLKRTKMYFGNLDTGASISGEASTGKAGVGGRATYMFVDEFAQIREDFEVMHRTADTTDCRIFNSTHKGVGTAFYELCERARKENYPRRLRLHWSEHPKKNPGLYQFDRETNRVEVKDPTYQYPPDFEFVEDGKPRSPWYDKECVRRKDQRAVAQDLDINPQGGLTQFFDPVIIRSIAHASARPALFEGDLEFDAETMKPHGLIPVPGGPLKIWVPLTHQGKPPAARYAIGGDVSAGTGATPSCFTVGNCSTGQKVAEYVNNSIQPEKLAFVIFAMGRFFAGHDGECAKLCWEYNGPGIVFGKKVQELGYPDMYYRRVETHRSASGVADAPGWYPSNDNKRILLEAYRSALYSRKFDNPSGYALEECLGFVYTQAGTVEHGGQTNTQDPSGARVNHGDPVIADALCWKMIDLSGLAAVVKPAENPQVLHPRCLAWRRQQAERQAEEEEAWA